MISLPLRASFPNPRLTLSISLRPKRFALSLRNQHQTMHTLKKPFLFVCLFNCMFVMKQKLVFFFQGIRKLCCELLDLKDSVENLCGNMHSKFLAFLR